MMAVIIHGLVVSFLLVLAACSGVHHKAATPGPWVIPTTGEPWPKPQQLVNYEGYVVVRPTTFTFEVWKHYSERSNLCS